MKKLVALLALATVIPTASFAADAIVGGAEATPFVSTVDTGAYNWTGLFVGLQGGMLGATLEDKGTSYRDVFGNQAAFGPVFGDFDDYGIVGGAHVGYDYQIGSFVVGAIADIEATDTSFKFDGLNGVAGIDGEVASVDYVGSVRARLGYAFDNTLVYATGGMAYARLDPNFDGAGKETEIGYTVGGGVEVGVFDNLSLRTEYRYSDVGDFGFSTSDGFGGRIDQNVDLKTHTIEAGVSYRFN